MISIEQQITACSTKLNPTPDDDVRLRHLLEPAKDRGRLVDRMFKEGLAGLFYKNLCRAGLLDTLNDDKREKLRRRYYRTVYTNLRRIHDLQQVLGRTNAEKIPVVLLKGIVLLEQVYQDIGLREMTDIDLWVLKKDYPGLIRILISQGYVRDPVYPNTFRKGTTIIGLHTHFLGADRIEARKLLLKGGQESVYAKTRIISFGGRNALCLNPYDQVLYLGLHALKHNVSHLIWLVDIRELVIDWQASDWMTMMDRAREMAQEKTLVVIFYLLHRLLGYPPPGIASRFLHNHRPNILEKRVLKKRSINEDLPAWAPILFFAPRKGFKKRVWFIFESVFPRPEILRQIFVHRPHSKAWQLYLLRAAQLANKAKIYIFSKS